MLIAERKGFIVGGIFIFRINDIIDLPIIDRTSGQRICTVKDVVIDTRENRVYALVCKERLIKRSIEIVPYNDVIAITQNYVVIYGKDSIINEREALSIYRRYTSIENILGKLVINSRGEILGIIRDLLINSADGHIKAYEYSAGYFDDLVSGRRIIQFDKSYNLAEKNMVLREYSPASYQYHK